MIRLFVLLIVAGAIFGSALHVSPWLIIGPLAVLALAAYGSGAAHLSCPECGKGIKLGYGRCHHCNWSRNAKDGRPHR